jgi:hypothetical protein
MSHVHDHQSPSPSVAAASGGASVGTVPCPSDTESLLYAVLDTAVDGIVVIDDQGMVSTFNRSAARLFGYSPDQVIGQNVSLLMPEPFRGEHDGYLRDYLSTGTARIIGIGREAVGRRKDATLFPIELAVSEVRLGNKRAFAGIIRDISQRKQLEREILEASEREQRKVWQDLHDGICQELAGISFLAQSMQRSIQLGDASTAEQAAKVTSLLRDAVRRTRILSHGLHPVEPLPNGLPVALRRLAEDTKQISRVKCSFRCARKFELEDASGGTHLFRIAQEAVRDAIRHGKASRIDIELAHRRNGITLRVSDNGLSLSADGRLREDQVLWMMEHRARVIGAKLRIEECSPGVRIVCELPATNKPLKGSSDHDHG